MVPIPIPPKTPYNTINIQKLSVKLAKKNPVTEITPPKKIINFGLKDFCCSK